MSQQINLYNPAFEHKRDLLSLTGAASAWGLAAGVVIVVMLAMSMRTSNLEGDLAQASAERDAALSEMNRLSAQLAARNCGREGIGRDNGGGVRPRNPAGDGTAEPCP